MSEEKTSAWPFADAPDTEGLDINAIFGGSTATTDVNPFEVPEPVQPEVPAAAELEAPQETVKEPPTPIAGAEQPEEPTSQQPDPVPAPEPTAEAENPIAAAFGQKTVENAQVGLLEKPPVFSYQNAKEPISGPGITFEELRLLKYEDFTDLEDGKNVSWCVEYCGNIAANYEAAAARMNTELMDDLAGRLLVLEQKVDKLEFYLKLLPDQEQKVVQAVYFQKKSLQMASDDLCTSIWAIRKNRDSAVKHLCEMYDFVKRG